jgi:hypothetical protein
MCSFFLLFQSYCQVVPTKALTAQGAGRKGNKEMVRKGMQYTRWVIWTPSQRQLALGFANKAKIVIGVWRFRVPIAQYGNFVSE